MDINTALGTLSPQRDDRLISQTQFAVFDGHTWVGSLKLLQPGDGYMIQEMNDFLDVNKDGVLNLGDVIYLLHIITGIR
ncbi:MAG: hypothetical protein OMM_13850 [Candidatus Magnetoglobus multicellularis str. Araruama]|uniref:EF-hand domain-containing protein n=1 Tax=Candidatus Magnetoglobus multicellularis str. Araruama TaxID=890399 RepID=A0A1V1NSX9_9BACT|nr:MAG: hypothetical protein OMM_13850 [Candidatus Magnetoglobus multicellularis str. Araruama]